MKCKLRTLLCWNPNKYCHQSECRLPSLFLDLFPSETSLDIYAATAHIVDKKMKSSHLNNQQ